MSVAETLEVSVAVDDVWDAHDEDETCLSWGRDTAAGLSARSLAGNYINEQSDVSPEVARSAYGPATYDRLVSLEQRYDPTNLFHLNQSVRPDR